MTTANEQAAGAGGSPTPHGPETAGPRLSSLGGASAPQQVLEDWRAYRELSPSIQSELWDLIAPSLAGDFDPKAFSEQTRSFCERHDVERAVVEPGVRICRLLLGQAARLDLDRATLARDIEVLAAGDPRGTVPLLAEFDERKRALRRQLVVATLADHGNVLVDVNWRIDSISASNRAGDLSASVVLMTFCYRSGDAADKLTLQLPLEAITSLKNLCSKIEAGFQA